MTLQGAIHELWANSAEADFVALRALLAADRVATGVWKKDDALPYCTINREGGMPTLHTNCGRLDSDTLRVQLWHDDFDSGAAIRDAIIEAFGNLDVTVDGKQIVCMRLGNNFDLEEEDGTWQFLIDFDVLH